MSLWHCASHKNCKQTKTGLASSQAQLKLKFHCLDIMGYSSSFYQVLGQRLQNTELITVAHCLLPRFSNTESKVSKTQCQSHCCPALHKRHCLNPKDHSVVCLLCRSMENNEEKKVGL